METRVNLSLIVEQGQGEGGKNDECVPGSVLCTIISVNPLAKQEKTSAH